MLQQNINHDFFFSFFFLALYFIQLWNSELSDSSRALFYRNISDFGFQSFLDVVQVKKFRIALL